MRRAAQAPRVYFSFRSPFSWLAITRLRRDVPGFFERVELIPYWDPDGETDGALRARGAEFHYVQMSAAKHRYLLHDTKRLAARLGVPMAWPIDVDPWWEPPHLAWLVARRHGYAERFYTAVTRERWERGGNICDPDVLARLATDVGLGAGPLVGACHDPDTRAESVECLARAYEDDIFGIPYFRVGRHRFWGYDRVDQFLEALLPVLDQQPAPPLPAAPPVLVSAAYDTDTAGGCG